MNGSTLHPPIKAEHEAGRATSSSGPAHQLW